MTDLICAGDECGEPIEPGQYRFYHHRLGVHVHAGCAEPGKTVKGEDISTHTMTFGGGGS